MNNLMTVDTQLSLEDKIKNACDREAESSRRWRQEQLDREREYQEKQTEASENMLPCLRHGNAKEYAEWLRGHLNEGGNITHVYDYDRHGIMVAKSDFTVVPLYGASSIDIIIPVGISVSTPNGTGHINLYYIDGFATNSNFVPLYNDVKHHLT